MHEVSGPLIQVARAALFKRAAQEQVSILLTIHAMCNGLILPQGGLLSGQDPSAFNTADPLRLWIIQLGVYDTYRQDVR